MSIYDTESSRSPRDVAGAGHVFTALVRADPGLVWTALTDPDQSGAYLYGMAAHSTNDQASLIGMRSYARALAYSANPPWVW